MRDARNPQHRPTARGFSLVEMVLSMAISTIIMGALVSVVVLMARSIDGGKTPEAQTAGAADAAQVIAADLRCATAVTELTATAVTVTVPDRDGNGTAETMRYAWSGTVGDPLTVQRNGGTALPLARDVGAMSVDSLVRIPPANVEGAEQVLFSNDPVLATGFTDFSEKLADWCAQYFRPTLPADAKQWKITKVRFMVRSDTAKDGVMKVRLVAPNAQRKPSATVLAEAEFRETWVGTTYAWYELAIGPVAGLDPAAGVCIVIAGVSGSATGAYSTFQYVSGGPVMPFNSHWMTSSTGGAAWTGVTDKSDMRFIVMGTVTTPGTCP